MRRTALAAGWLVVCATTLLPAQSDSSEARPAGDSTDVLVLDHDFTAGGGDLARVFLRAKQVYRAEMNTPDVTISIRSLLRGQKSPRVYSLLPSNSASGSSVFEVYPDHDGDYELQALSASGRGVATRLRLYRDIRESRRRMAVVDRPGWEIGVEVAAGWHSGFDQRSPGAPALRQDGGSDIEACFVARNAPEARYISMCALGVGHGSQRGTPATLWIFSEPRLRLLGKYARGKSNWEIGGLFRLAIGSVSGSSETPVMLAPGLYVARHIRTDESGAGWSLHASYSFASLRNVPKFPDGDRPTTRRLLLGVGWYQ